MVLIAGIMAAGTSTVAEEPARRLLRSEQTPAQTVDEILARAAGEGRIG